MKLHNKGKARSNIERKGNTTSIAEVVHKELEKRKFSYFISFSYCPFESV
jgi:hypothetical protein